MLIHQPDLSGHPMPDDHGMDPILHHHPAQWIQIILLQDRLLLLAGRGILLRHPLTPSHRTI